MPTLALDDIQARACFMESLGASYNVAAHHLTRTLAASMLAHNASLSTSLFHCRMAHIMCNKCHISLVTCYMCTVSTLPLPPPFASFTALPG